MSRLLTQEELPRLQQLTDSYEPNEVVLDQFRSSKFAIIAGPSGAGKDTLRNLLIEQYPKLYRPVLSTTTRPMRQGERDGVDYHFSTVESVEARLIQRDFFQAALVHNQQISCLHIDDILRLQPDQTGLSILIVQTEQQLSKLKDDIKTIFLIPPDIDTLRQRLSYERPLGNDEIQRRMEAGAEELKTALGSTDYYCLVSGDKGQLVHHAHNFLQLGIKHPEADAEARSTIETILNMLSN